MHPLDPWRAAHLLLHRHGDDAELHAARRADELSEAGDETGYRVWKQVLAALGELRRTRPRAEEARAEAREDRWPRPDPAAGGAP